jgi:hypothetical protein
LNDNWWKTHQNYFPVSDIFYERFQQSININVDVKKFIIFLILKCRNCEIIHISTVVWHEPVKILFLYNWLQQKFSAILKTIVVFTGVMLPSEAKRHTKAGFPLRPYRTETYWWACADWKEVYKSTYFRVYSRIKIKSSSQVDFLVYYGSTNQSTFAKFWNLKTFLIRFGTVRLKWKTGFMSTHTNVVTLWRKIT